jgi:hypothetical protein
MYEGFAAIAGLADLSDQSCRWQAVDLCMLPTITFRLLSCLVILRHGRRLPVFVRGDDKLDRGSLDLLVKSLCELPHTRMAPREIMDLTRGMVCRHA